MRELRSALAQLLRNAIGGVGDGTSYLPDIYNVVAPTDRY